MAINATTVKFSKVRLQVSLVFRLLFDGAPGQIMTKLAQNSSRKSTRLLARTPGRKHPYTTPAPRNAAIRAASSPNSANTSSVC